MGPRAGLDAMEKKNRTPENRTPVVQSVARRYTTELSQLRTIAGNE
jgi:hypothetical protein